MINHMDIDRIRRPRDVTFVRESGSSAAMERGSLMIFAVSGAGPSFRVQSGVAKSVTASLMALMSGEL